MTLIKEQRNLIIIRDQGKCQFPKLVDEEFETCGSQIKLEVHHILPQRWAYTFLGLTVDEEDDPRNLLTLCKAHHDGVIHPDMQEALDEYRRGDKAAFKKKFAARDEEVQEKEPYWNDEWDQYLSQIANARTDAMAIRGWRWKHHNGRKNERA